MAFVFTGRFSTGDMIVGTDLRDLEIAVQDGQATLYAASGMNGGISRWQLSGNGGLGSRQQDSLAGADAGGLGAAAMMCCWVAMAPTG